MLEAIKLGIGKLLINDEKEACARYIYSEF